jgi:hypothetical protein
MKKVLVCALMVSFGIASLASAAPMTLGETWDVADDMVFTHTEPLGVNGEGEWTYGATPAEIADRDAPDTTTILPFDASFAEAGTGCPWWQFDPAWYAAIPAVWLGAAYGSLADQVGIHPGYQVGSGNPLNTATVIRWTAPGEGTIDIDGVWEAAIANKRDLYVIKNGTEVLQKVLDNTGSAEVIDLTQTVVMGDTLDFVVGVGSDSGGGADSQSLDLAIEVVVPEPVTMTLLGLGSLVLLRRRK